MGMRVRARIEHKAAPITRTMTEIGLRSALRRSHMTISLLARCFAKIREMARDRLAPPRPKPGFATPLAGPARRQSPPARESFGHPRHRRAWPTRPDSAPAAAFPSCGQHQAAAAYSRRPFALHRAKLAPCGVVRLGPAGLGRSGLLPHV